MASLALEYRPQSFDDLVGQIHASRSLRNAIIYKKIGHAYLFFGSRGVGKTTTARILAKALNCSEGPTPSPCTKCVQCKNIASGNDIDVLEMDAASNRGIEHIRNLRESAQFAPMKSKFKIYIIDEVHMLTNESFNALLKILEEPPSHVVFIMATTEQHKIPETILSRTQVFAFKKFNLKDIQKRLVTILDREKISYQKEALLLIADQAEGSMRDALSIIDQIIAYVGNSTITSKDVRDVLGILPNEIFEGILESFRVRNISSLMLIIDQLAMKGIDLKQFLWDILIFIKNISLITYGSISNENWSQSEKEKFSTIAKIWDTVELSLVFQNLFQIYTVLKQANHRSSEIRITLEMAILDTIEKLEKPSISGVLTRLANLQEALKTEKPFKENLPSVSQNLENNQIFSDYQKSKVDSNSSEKIQFKEDPETILQKEFMASPNQTDEKIFGNDNN